MSELSYRIDSSWCDDVETPSSIGEKFPRMLEQLGPLSPAMRNWQLFDQSDGEVVLLADVESRMTEFVAGNFARDEYDDPRPGGGYTMIVTGAPERLDQITPQTAVLNIDLGSSSSNQAMFEMGGLSLAPDLALVTYPTYRGAMEILASLWPCPWLYALATNSGEFEPLRPVSTNLDFEAELARPVDPYPARYMGWIGYLSAPLAAGLTPPPDLICERTPGGGLILSAISERLDPGDPDHMRRSRMLSQIMSERTGAYSRQVFYQKHSARVGPY
jgi:hypothetical protein